MSDLTPKEKLLLGALTFILSFALFNFFFSLSEFVKTPSLAAYLGGIPKLWPIKSLISLAAALFVVQISSQSSLDNIKAKQIGDGQYGTARWATETEKKDTYTFVPFGHERKPGIVVESCKNGWLVDVSDQTAMLVAPPGAGKTTSEMIPTVCYNAVINVNRHTRGQGPSMILTDCKGELYSRTGAILQEKGYRTPFLDFRSPLHSYQFNLLVGVNRHMDIYQKAQSGEEKIISYGRAERYAKILAETIVENVSVDQKSEASEYFNETSKGLLTGIILLVSEYGEEGERHIISVFRLIIELNGLAEGSNDMAQKSKLEHLLQFVDNERIVNYVGPAMKADVRTSMNVFSSALGKLVSFIDAELEQLVCGHSPELNDLDFIKYPTAIFLLCPDENKTRHFFAALYIRYLMNDLIEQASRNKSLTLEREVLCIWDEFGQMPPVKDVDMLFTAARSRRIRFLISLQSYAQLEKVYNHRQAKIIRAACQMKLYTYLADYEEAENLSKALGECTVQSGSVSSSTRDGFWTDSSSKQTQMIKRRLITADEIMTMPIGDFILRKAGGLSVRTHLAYFASYLKEYPPYWKDIRYPLQNLDYLSEEKIIHRARARSCMLTLGMFD